MSPYTALHTPARVNKQKIKSAWYPRENTGKVLSKYKNDYLISNERCRSIIHQLNVQGGKHGSRLIYIVISRPVQIYVRLSFIFKLQIDFDLQTSFDFVSAIPDPSRSQIME